MMTFVYVHFMIIDSCTYLGSKNKHLILDLVPATGLTCNPIPEHRSIHIGNAIDIDKSLLLIAGVGTINLTFVLKIDIIPMCI